MLMRSSILASHGVLPLGLPFYTKTPGRWWSPLVNNSNIQVSGTTGSTFVDSSAEVERKSSAPYHLKPGGTRGSLYQSQDYIAFQSRHVVWLLVCLQIVLGLTISQFQFCLIPARARE